MALLLSTRPTSVRILTFRGLSFIRSKRPLALKRGRESSPLPAPKEGRNVDGCHAGLQTGAPLYTRSVELDHIFEDGLAELHTHLGGSVASDIMWSLAH